MQGSTREVSTQNLKQSSTKFWLRWLTVIPGALLAALIAAFPLHWAVLLVTSMNTGQLGIGMLPPEVLERLGMAFFMPFVLLIVGGSIAPKFKPQTTGVLAVGWVITFVFALAFSTSQPGIALDYSGVGWLEFIAAIALAGAGVWSGFYYGALHR